MARPPQLSEHDWERGAAVWELQLQIMALSHEWTSTRLAAGADPAKGLRSDSALAPTALQAEDVLDRLNVKVLALADKLREAPRCLHCHQTLPEGATVNLRDA